MKLCVKIVFCVALAVVLLPGAAQAEFLGQTAAFFVDSSYDAT